MCCQSITPFTKGCLALTVSQAVVPVFIPLWLDIVLCRGLHHALPNRGSSCHHKSTSVVHDSCHGAFKFVTDSDEGSPRCRARVIVPELGYVSPFGQVVVEHERAHTRSIRRPESPLRNSVVTSLMPLIPRKTRCLPWGDRNEQSRASLSSSKDDFPCRGASQGAQGLTKANHLPLVSNRYQHGNPEKNESSPPPNPSNPPFTISVNVIAYLRNRPHGTPSGTSAYVDSSSCAPSTPASTDQSRVPGVWLIWLFQLRSGFSSWIKSGRSSWPPSLVGF